MTPATPGTVRSSSSSALQGAPPLYKCRCINADNRSCTLGADSQYVELAVEVFAMLADATRVRIILALRDGETAVGALAEAVGKSPAAVSQHLAKMRLARMVSTRQDGTKVMYRLENEHARQLVADAIYQAEHALGFSQSACSNSLTPSASGSLARPVSRT